MGFIVKPLSSYTVHAKEGSPNEGWVEVEFVGRDGESAVVMWNDFDDLASVAELLWEAAVDLHQVREQGIYDLLDTKGEIGNNPHEILTVEHLLDESGNPGAIAKRTRSLKYPWYPDEET